MTTPSNEKKASSRNSSHRSPAKSASSSHRSSHGSSAKSASSSHRSSHGSSAKKASSYRSPSHAKLRKATKTPEEICGARKDYEIILMDDGTKSCRKRCI